MLNICGIMVQFWFIPLDKMFLIQIIKIKIIIN